MTHLRNLKIIIFIIIVTDSRKYANYFLKIKSLICIKTHYRDHMVLEVVTRKHLDCLQKI